VKIRVGVIQRYALIEARCDQTERRRFGFAANVVTRKLERTARADKAFLADAEFIPQADGRKPWNDDRTHGNVSVPRNNFDASADVHRVAARLVDSNDNNLLPFLVRRFADGSNAGPIEHTDAVKIALRLEKLRLTESVARLDIFPRDRPDE